MGKITLNHITKIEGHARLDIYIEDGELKKCELGSVEGSRYFEGLIKGHIYYSAPEITSRICGICSSAHGVVSVTAMERALGIEVTEQTIILRELQSIGERIRSHAAHLYLLALPDYLGYKSAIAMAEKYPEEVKRALRLIKLGNDMVTLVSGRVMHQVASDIGGFNHFPTQRELDKLKELLIGAKSDIMETAELIASLEVPELQNDSPFFCLSRDDKYATSYGYIKVGDKTFEQKDYQKVIEEYHEPHSNANFVVKEGKAYYVGALARVNNNLRLLSPETKEFMSGINVRFPSNNPFHNNLAQALELIHYREECVNILDDFKIKHEKKIDFTVKEGHGIAANEAPRGTVWHEYKINDKGIITYANVITPTAQYMRHMQDSIEIYVRQLLENNKKEDEIVFEVEKLIRSYDPCLSCATHFLEVKWHRS